MSDAPDGSGRLPDEAFADPRRLADQTEDRHDAFPVSPGPVPASPGPLTPTAWARPLRNATSPAAQEVPTPHRTLAGRRLATLAVALLMTVPVGLGVTSLTSDSGARQGPELVYGQEFGGVWRSLPADAVAPIQPHDQPLQALPVGPSRIRVEVVAAGVGTTSLDLQAPEGGAMRVDLALPAVFEVMTGSAHEGVGVLVAPNDEQLEVQCRVYADDRLVAISTGRSIVECVAEPAP